MARVKFNEIGQQKMFINYVKQKSGNSLRKIAKIHGANYELMKKYYQEKCLIPENIFDLLCKISGVKKGELNVSYLRDYWGQVKGGKS